MQNNAVIQMLLCCDESNFLPHRLNRTCVSSPIWPTMQKYANNISWDEYMTMAVV